MDWLPALSSTAILGIVGFILSVPYRRAIEGAISSRFEGRLESTKAEFRRQEELLRAELRTRDAELEALRSGALSSLAARQADMGRRRITAVEKVWAHVINASKYKLLSKFAETLNTTAMLEAAESNPSDKRKLQHLAETLLKSANADDPGQYDSSADMERPFLPEITWALFLAYRQLLLQPLAFLHLIKAGASGKLLADPSRMADVLKKSLPQYATFIDEHGPAGYPFLLDELEQALLTSLRQALDQSDADEGAVQQAARIIAAVNAAAAKSNEDMPDLPIGRLHG